MPLIVSYGSPDNLAKIVQVKTLTWDQYRAELSTPVVGTDKAAGGWSIPASFSPAYRDSENCVARYALTFDYDKVTPEDTTLIFKAYEDYEYLAYQTFSHSPDKPRWRFVFPLSRPVTFDEFQAVSRKVASWAGIELAARESHVPAQMMFLPVVKSDRGLGSVHNTGTVLNVEDVLASYMTWTDRSEWPHRKDADVLSGADVAVDPTTKPGIVGDFCRAYTISAAIEKFKLPYEHVDGDRYTYTAGSRPEGAIIYDDDKKLHSHHDSDPAHGQHNAFDLTRLHHFGGLDAESAVALPITERPSFRAMVALATDDPAVRRQAALTEFEDIDEPKPALEAPRERLAQPVSVLCETPTQTRWLIRNELERGVMALMAGPRGSYKSFKAIHWAMSCAVQGLPVYVISAEGGDFGRRVSAWMKHHDLTIYPPLYVVERRIDLNTQAGVETIRQDCLAWGIRPVLFVLDTFSKLSGGLDENDNSQVKQFIGRLDNGLKRPDAFDATVLLVAHTGHSDASRARGASALEADTDAAYIVQKDPVGGTVRVTRERFKSSSELPPMVYQPKIITLDRLDDEGQAVTSVVLEPADLSRVKGLRKPGGAKQRLMMDVLKELAPDGSTVEVDRLLTTAAQRLPRDISKRDTRRATMRQALDGMVINKVVFLHEDGISSTPVIVEDWLNG